MLSIHEGSILDCKVDAIVNPANGHLNHGGGLARIIDRAATHPQTAGIVPPASLDATDAAHDRFEQAMAPAIQWRTENAEAPLIATGAAYATSAGLLPFKAVIHAVGPIWNGGDFYEPQLLKSAYVNALRVAIGRGYISIAVPAISCGIFGYPVDLAAPVAVRACIGAPIDVTFALMPNDGYAPVFEKWINSLQKEVIR